MPPNDQAPRYQLVDPSTGNVVGSVFGDGNGNVEIQDETGTSYLFPSNPSSGTDVARFQDLPSDTRTDISDGGTTVVSDTSDINFASNVSVTDDGDGTVTVDATSTDTRTDVSNNGTTVVSETTDIDFTDLLVATDDTDGTGSVAFDASDGTAPTGLDVELVDGSDTVQASANTVNNQSTSTPVASFTNASGSTSVFKLRVNNTTGSAINSPGVGAKFGWQVA